MNPEESTHGYDIWNLTSSQLERAERLSEDALHWNLCNLERAMLDIENELREDITAGRKTILTLKLRVYEKSHDEFINDYKLVMAYREYRDKVVCKPKHYDNDIERAIAWEI